MANSGKGGESDIQSHYIIGFRYPGLNKNHSVFKKKKNMKNDSFKQKINQQKPSLKKT